MITNQKSQTIKIDIRSLGYGGKESVVSKHGATPNNGFSAMDYRFFFENTYDAIVMADSHGRVLDANGRALRFFGYDEVDLTGMPLRSLIAGVTDSLLADVREVITKGGNMRIQAFAVHRGEMFSAVEIVVMGSSAHAVDSICYLIRDTQSRWQAEQRLMSVYHAMDNTDSGIGIVDMQGEITYANCAMIKLLAVGVEKDVVGQHLNRWFDHKQVIEPMLANIGQRKGWNDEQRVMAGEQSGWLMISAVPDIDEDNELCGMVLSIRDTAERRRAEMAEQQVERNRVIMESLAEICHALGQPATVLLTGIEMLKLSLGRDEVMCKEMIELCYDAVIELREHLQKMNSQGIRSELVCKEKS